MKVAWRFVTDDDIRSASAVVLCEANGPWSQNVTDTSRHLPGVTYGAAQHVAPALIIEIDPADFDAVVERIRSLRSDVPPDLNFTPA